jgi:hypothetical protein
MKETEVKARLAQAEAHFSHYRWEDAIAIFEAVLASHPDHPLATQGWAHAVEQKSVDEELKEALAKARASLAADRFDEALALLNHAQTRGALSQILRYHSEIDGLRSEAQEGQEWQRRTETAMREAQGLASRRRFEQALETIDGTLRPLNARAWDRLGAGLAALREKLWAERDVSERIQFAQAAYDRQDYGLASELAAALREEFPEREDARRLHERARGAWSRLHERLAAVDEALAEERIDDALALLGSLRGEHPRNPDWQAVALRIYVAQGRENFARGRAAMAEQAFEYAAEAFDAAVAAFTAIVEIFPEHPTAAQEQSEARALRLSTLAAHQAARDRDAFRWEASRAGWQTSREQLGQAIAERGHDFGEIAAVVDAALGDSEAALADLERARLLLADGRQSLELRDAGSAREAFRAGLSRLEGGRLGEAPRLHELREGLIAGLREAERIQRDVKKLLSHAEAAAVKEERLALLRRAFERWETAPGLPARLAEELVAAASASAQTGDEEAALAYCREAGELAGAPSGALGEASRIAAAIAARRQEAAAEAEAAEQRARAEAWEASLAPVVDALQTAEALCEPAGDGDLAGVDWEGAERSLKEARKALRVAGRALPQPLPARWDELRGRIEALERRNRLLAAAGGQIANGQAVTAMTALSAYTDGESDPLVLSVLERVAATSGGAAADSAREWLAQADSALARGELTTAAAYVELARSCEAIAPLVVPQIRGVERQIALLSGARDRTREARALTAAGDLQRALASYRVALELLADGETGLPAASRREIQRILFLSDTPNGEDALPALPDVAQHPLAQEFIAPALEGWWRVARQASALAQVEAQAALGQEAEAAAIAARLAQAHPDDRRLLEAYKVATAGAVERQSARWLRRLKRASRLAELGAYAEALAEIDAAGGTSDWTSQPQGEASEQLADEAADLRLALTRLLKLSEQLAPLVEQVRDAALDGRFDDALALRDQGEFQDPRRDAAPVWEELDALAGLIEKRRARDAEVAALPERPGPRVAPEAAPAPPPAPTETPDRQQPDHFGGASGEGWVAAAPAGQTPARAQEEATRDTSADPLATLAPVAQQHQEADRADHLVSSAGTESFAVVPVEPVEPFAPFDLDDWLKNVTELGPDDSGPGNES